jgi:hypothetical protein
MYHRPSRLLKEVRDVVENADLSEVGCSGGALLMGEEDGVTQLARAVSAGAGELRRCVGPWRS